MESYWERMRAERLKELDSAIVSECDTCGKITKVKRYGRDKEYAYCDKCMKEMTNGK